jgi:hypothetical protein
MPEIFSPEINWIDSLLEEREYETGIIVSHGEVDQRISLIDTPNRRFTYSISALDEREAALLESLIRRVQGEACYVPYWRGARYVSALNLVPGFGNEILVNTVNAGFEVDNWVMLFVDAHRAAVAKITAVTSTAVFTDAVIPGTWPIGRTKAVPVFLGQLGASVPIDYAAKFAKVVQVAFDVHPVRREFSGDCNWALTNPWTAFLFGSTTWEIDPTGGPTGGPAMKMTVPANSRVFGSVSPIVQAIMLDGLPPGLYTMEAKVKTDWDVTDPALGLFDGRPGILLNVSSGVGGSDIVTAAAFNAWETLTAVETVGTDRWLSPKLTQSEGTVSEVPLTAWFADVIIRDPDNNIIHRCLPAADEVVPTDTPIFAPLTALHRPGASMQSVHRTVDTLSSPAGAFAVYPRADVPYTEHPLSLVFFNAEEAYAFQLFFDLVMGAFGAFWLPSYQQDLTPIGTIADDATTFDIRHCGYTALDFPGTQRRQIAFVQPDGSFIKRSITAAVDNGDETETLTINEPLGFEFRQNNANGICFLWYCRFMDDLEKMEWIDDDRATLEITVIEIANPPDGGSGDSADGFLSDVP